MNAVDTGLVLVLLVAAIRGYTRGVVREIFSLLALLVGLYAAFAMAPTVEAAVASRYVLPDPVGAGLAFVVVFTGVYVAFSICGALFDRRGASVLVRVVTGMVGAAVAGGKAITVAAFVLLCVHLFPVVPGVERQLMGSALGRPIVAAAERAVRFGVTERDAAKTAGES